MNVELNKTEYAYLRKATFLPKIFKGLLSSCDQREDGYLLEISDEYADELRDLFGEQLQVVGFDEEYSLTEEGKVLEALIDKFFIG